MLKKLLSILTLALTSFCDASLISDLELAAYYDRKLNESLPVTFNYLLSTGYFTTQSARMRQRGEFSIGGASTPPYSLINLRFQPFSHLELTGNYRLFNGVKDHGLSPYGFGDFADRGAGLKLALALPEDTCNQLPGLAIGIDDFMGSKRFTTPYIVATQVWIDYGLEMSLGWGSGRYSRGPSRGFFGGISWFPFFGCDNRWIERCALVLEYDPTDYRKDPHPCARKANTHFNGGIQYNFSDLFSFSVSSLRGKEVAFGGSLSCNLGQCAGFLPKLCDPPPYREPLDKESRAEDLLVTRLNCPFQEQGFYITRGWIEGNHLTLSVLNQRYRCENDSRCRLERLLYALVPVNIEVITVLMESYGFPCQEYVYSQELLCKRACDLISPYEFDLLTPRYEACPPCGRLIYASPPARVCTWFAPRLETFLGGRKGKFKYALGAKGGIDGLLPYGIFYDVQVCYTPLSTAKDVSDFDFYNPSQLPNVLTDFVNYRKVRTFSTERAYLQKNWNMGCGTFSSLCGGYFQVNYAGIGGEVLWYPANSYFAVGIEGALLKKRRYTGLGFQDKLRRLQGHTPTYQSYSLLSQYFLDFYVDVPEWKLAAKASVGGFLAYDKGGRLEVTRYFESGLRVTGWMTFTNAYDQMHGENYFNRGIAIELPLDLFCKRSNRKVCNYGMAAWLRDAGAFIPVGRSLFDIINRERRN